MANAVGERAAQEHEATGQAVTGHEATGHECAEREALVETVDLACWVCGSSRLDPFKPGNLGSRLTPEDLRITDARYGVTLPLVRCLNCGFRFAASPEVARLDELYAELSDPGYEGSQESRELQMRWLVKLAREAHPGAKTALDVGAASGLLVAEAARQGLEAVGVEPSHSLVSVAREQAGGSVLHGTLPHASLEDRRFDVVFLVDVIEHVADPVGLLGHCADRLADDGVMLVVTPDAGSIAARLLRSRWWHYRVAHVGYFDRPSLDRAFERAGLRAVRRIRARWFFSVDYLATRVERYLPVAWWNRFARRFAPLRWLYARVIPLNLFDSDAVLLRRAGRS